MRLFFLISLLFFSCYSIAGSLNSNGKYQGKVLAVAVGHWGHVGVQLDDINCNGKSVVLLKKDSTMFEAYYSLLLTAQASKQDVEINRLTNPDNFHLGYCVIEYIAIGDLSDW